MSRGWIGVRPPAVGAPVVTALTVSCVARRSAIRTRTATSVSVVRRPAAVLRVFRRLTRKALAPLGRISRRIVDRLPAYAARVSVQLLALPPPVTAHG